MKIPVGKVHLVDQEGRFVLIRSSKVLKVEPGTFITLFDQSGHPAGTVKASPARRGAFLTADIVEGNPMVGQQALMDFSAEKAMEKPEGPAMSDDDIQVLE